MTGTRHAKIQTPETQPSWLMFAFTNVDTFTRICPNPTTLKLFGSEPVAVDVSVSETGDYYGLLTDGAYPTHVQSSHPKFIEALRSAYCPTPIPLAGIVTRFQVERARSTDRLKKLFEDLGPVRIAFWTCPVPEHSNRTNTVIVKWVGDVAHCTATGCPLTSETFNYAKVEGFTADDDGQNPEPLSASENA